MLWIIESIRKKYCMMMINKLLDLNKLRTSMFYLHGLYMPSTGVIILINLYFGLIFIVFINMRTPSL